MTLAQARSLAFLTEQASERWLFGDEVLTKDLVETVELLLWQTGTMTMVLVEPTGSWFEIAPSGETSAAGAASRAERLTVGFYCSRFWADQRHELAGLGQTGWGTIVAEALDEDDEHERMTIVLVTADGRVVEWQSRAEGGTLVDLTSDWREGSAWRAAVSDALTARRRLFPSADGAGGSCSRHG